MIKKISSILYYRRHQFSFFLLSFWGLFITLNAQVRVSVSAPSVVNLGQDYFQIKYTVNTDKVSDIQLRISDFNLLSGPDQSVRKEVVSVNGKTSSHSSTTITYTLQAKEKGKFTLPSAAIKVNGQIYHSKSVTIQVVGNRSEHKGPSSSANSTSSSGDANLRRAGSQVSLKDLYVSAKLQKKIVYEQEAVRLGYYFYERPGVGLNNIGLNKKPDFKGIVSQELPIKSIETSLSHVGGTVYKTGKIQEYLLFPQQSGRILLPSLTFDCVIVQRDPLMNEIDAFFNGGGTIGVNIKRSSTEQYLEVRPLPSPKPSGFSGGVGHFRISSKMMNSNVRTNELATFRVTISGDGNLKLLTAPNLIFPEEFDSYSPKVVDETKVTENGVVGSISFDYTLVPRSVGKYRIPDINFIYFDPNEGNYKTVHASGFMLDVKKGTKSDSAVEYECRMRNSDIRDINRSRANLVSYDDYYWWGTWGTYAVFALIFVATLLIYHNEKKIENLFYHSVRCSRTRIERKTVKELFVAKKMADAGQKREAYGKMSNALCHYFSEIMSMPVNEINVEKISNHLIRNHVDDKLIEKLCQLFETCEMVNYAPIGQDSDVQNDFDEAIQIVKSINTTMVQP